MTRDELVERVCEEVFGAAWRETLTEETRNLVRRDTRNGGSVRAMVAFVAEWLDAVGAATGRDCDESVSQRWREAMG